MSRSRCARPATTARRCTSSRCCKASGRLLLRYHFADEAEQIRQLTLPFAAPRGEGEAPVEQPGLDEDAAAYAVLGVDIEAFGNAATRQWGLGDDVLHMIRRLPADVPVRKPDSDDELLRIVASAANEAVDALELRADESLGRAQRGRGPLCTDLAPDDANPPRRLA